MKKVLTIAGIATLVAILGVTAIGAVAFAQEAEDGEWPFDFGAKFRDAVAGALGISVEEYDAAVETAQGQVLEDAVNEGWLTQEQADSMQERFAEGAPAPGFGGPRGGKGGMPGKMPAPKRGDKMGGAHPFEAAAEALDMTMEDLMAALKDGTTVAELAAEAGVDTQVIVDAAVTQLGEQLDEAVADGKLTRERADWMLEQAGEKIKTMIEEGVPMRQGDPGHFPGGGRPRPGGFQGFPGQDDV